MSDQPFMDWCLALEARVRELETVARWLKECGSKHGMPDEVAAILQTVNPLSADVQIS